MIRITLKRQEKTVSMKCEGDIPLTFSEITNGVWSSDKDYIPFAYGYGFKIWFGLSQDGFNSYTFNTREQALESMQKTTEAAKDMIVKIGKTPRVRRIK